MEIVLKTIYIIYFNKKTWGILISIGEIALKSIETEHIFNQLDYVSKYIRESMVCDWIFKLFKIDWFTYLIYIYISKWSLSNHQCLVK